MLKNVVFIFFCLLSCFTLASTQSNLQEIAKDPKWLKLLTVYSKGTPTVTDDAFLLSSQKSFDPLNELILTLDQFKASLSEGDINQHAQCRYPARRIYLEQKLSFDELGIKSLACPAFDAFANIGEDTSLSLVYATGFLGNPASYYGHILLKINQGNKSPLDQTSINFGADIPVDEGMLSYITKGIFGRYNSSFTEQPFFYHFNNYNETEHRDLWEFPLSLKPVESKLLIAHIWELMNADFQYYFFNRNCAYFMAKALELVLDSPLISESKPWVAPQEIVQKLKLQFSDSSPIINEHIYWPSRQTRLYQRFHELDIDERQLIRAMVLSPEKIILETLEGLPLSSQHKIVDTIIDYYQFIRDSQDTDDLNNQIYNQAVLLRYQLPISNIKTEFTSSNIPSLGRGVSRTWFGANQHGLLLGIRPAYYDALDASYGHVKHAGLAMGEFEFTVDRSDIRLYSLNLLNIKSIKQNYTMLPGDKNHSWFLKVGAEQMNFDCESCLAPLIEGGAGVSKALAHTDITLSTFASLGFHSEKLVKEGVFIGADLNAAWRITDRYSAYFQINHKYYHHRGSQGLVKVSQRFEMTDLVDTRLIFEYDLSNSESKTTLNFGYYW